MKYRQEIDGLRALAVVPVIFFHAGFGVFSGGFVGVDVFFVVSGYLITSIILAELDVDGFSILGFYERRARRILPALFLVLGTCQLLAWYWLPPVDMKSFAQSVAAVSLFGSNILFWHQSGYFDVAVKLKPLLHTWSLAVEEQFYLLFPLLLIWARRLRQSWTFTLLLFVSLISLSVAQWGIAHAPTAAYFLLPARAWELMLGALVAVHLARRQTPSRLSPAITSGLGMAGAALILGSAILFDESTPFPGFYALVPTVGAALIILFAGPENHIGRWLSSKAMVGAGLLSYSAYLWHQPMFAFARHKTYEEPSAWTFAALIAATWMLAYLSWRFVEQPFRRKNAVDRRTVFSLAMTGSVLLCVGGILGHVSNGFENRVTAQPFLVFQYQPEKLGYLQCDDKALLGGEPLNYCNKSSRGPVNAALIGDSHAEDKYYGLEKVDPYRRWLLVGNSSCPPLLGVQVEADQKKCREKFEKIVAWVSAQPGISTVVLSFFGQYPLTTAYAADHRVKKVGPDVVKISSEEFAGVSRSEMFYAGLVKTVQTLIQHGKQVVVLQDIPELPFFPVDCVKAQRDCDMPVQDTLTRQTLHRQMLVQLQKKFPEIRVFDPTPLFCDAQRCNFKKDGTILYRDSHHLTLVGSEYYGRQFVSWLGSGGAVAVHTLQQRN